MAPAALPRRARPADSVGRLAALIPRFVGLALLVAVSLVMLAPIVWAVSTSLRNPARSFSVPPQWFPNPVDWSNYERVFTTVPFMTYVANSAFVTVMIVAGQLVTSALAGYAFARLEFPFKNALFWLVLATLMIPLQATLIPVFVLISRLGLADTPWSLILPAWATAFGAFLLRQHFMTLPKEYEEAAMIDGAGQFRIFRSIYLPLAMPSLAILAVLSFNTHWNEFTRPLIFLTSPDRFTLPVGLVSLAGFMGTGSISVVLAGVALSLLPVLIIYLIGQRYLIEGIARGGVKG